MVEHEYVYQIFTDSSTEFDRAVISNGDIMVEARLSENYTAHIQTDTIVSNDSLPPVETERLFEECVEFIEHQLARPENTYVV